MAERRRARRACCSRSRARRSRSRASAATRRVARARGCARRGATLRHAARLDGELRGCIGTLEPHRPLGDDVAHNALAAAFAIRASRR